MAGKWTRKATMGGLVVSYHRGDQTILRVFVSRTQHKQRGGFNYRLEGAGLYRTLTRAKEAADRRLT